MDDVCSKYVDVCSEIIQLCLHQRHLSRPLKVKISQTGVALKYDHIHLVLPTWYEISRKQNGIMQFETRDRK